MTIDVLGPTAADLRLLTGGCAAELMTTVVSTAGGRLVEWSVGQVDHQPGRRTTVSYAARVRWADGSVTGEVLGASSGALPKGVATVTDGQTEIGMWRFPFDSDLPGLPAACDPAAMARLATSVGLGGAGGVRLRVRAYRPRRRAVVQVTSPAGTLFVKVVRPRKARGLYERHRVATAAGCPVPAPLGWTDDGLVALAGLPGRTLRDLLVGDGPVALRVEDVVGLLDTLPDELPGRRATWGQKAPHYAEVIAAVTPTLAQRARAMARAVDHTAPEGPQVAVHGDFYESQLMVRHGRVIGLLDLDTAGRGERLDDAGCLLAHLSVLAQIHPPRAAQIIQLGLAVQRRFGRELDRAALARRTAAVVLSLATGPHRVQQPDWRGTTADRIALAERWLNWGTESTVERAL